MERAILFGVKSMNSFNTEMLRINLLTFSKKWNDLVLKIFIRTHSAHGKLFSWIWDSEIPTVILTKDDPGARQISSANANKLKQFNTELINKENAAKLQIYCINRCFPLIV